MNNGIMWRLDRLDEPVDRQLGQVEGEPSLKQARRMAGLFALTRLSCHSEERRAAPAVPDLPSFGSAFRDWKLRDPHNARKVLPWQNLFWLSAAAERAANGARIPGNKSHK